MKLARLLNKNASAYIICAVMITILTAPVLSLSLQAGNSNLYYALQDEIDSPVDYEPVETYFDPADYDVVNYVRQDLELTDRSMDSEELLFGSVDQETADANTAAPPDLTFAEDNTKVYVNVQILNMREYPILSSPVIHVYGLGDMLIRTGIGKEWDRVTNSDGITGYVMAEYVDKEKPEPSATPTPKVNKRKITAPAVANTLGQSIVLEAKKYLGIRYRGGYADPNKGFDCSGFTWYVFNRYGISTPRGTSSYYHAGIVIPYSQIAPGDVIAWDTRKYDRRTTITHVGIYIGGGMMIHASSSHNAIAYRSVAEYKAGGCRIISVHRFIKK